MPNLSKREAIEYFGLDPKVFDNYFKNAGEFNCLPRHGGRGRFQFDRDALQRWLDSYKWRTVELDLADYALCLDFALAQHFRGYVLSDWGTARQREFGQKITNWVKGQLAEVAVKKFIERECDVNIELDFGIHEEIVPQDIIGIYEHGGRREPRIDVGIKSSKPKSSYLILGENEVVLPTRTSEVYIFCRPNMPDDHLLRLTRDQIIKTVEKQPHYSDYQVDIPYFENIPCEIAGYCWKHELEEVRSIPGQDFDGIRYVKKSGLLHRSREEWVALLRRI